MLKNYFMHHPSSGTGSSFHHFFCNLNSLLVNKYPLRFWCVFYLQQAPKNTAEIVECDYEQPETLTPYQNCTRLAPGSFVVGAILFS